MYAIIKTGGKQYKVSEGDEIIVEKLGVEEGEKVTFEEVFAIVDGEDVKIGQPKIDGAKVTASVVKNGKGPKIRIFKYKHKTNYRRRMGHRQPFTKVKIEKIEG
jgi:large subunit ribosomal protein L21